MTSRRPVNHTNKNISINIISFAYADDITSFPYECSTFINQFVFSGT